MKKKEKYLILDESGNLGRQGRFFVIACIQVEDIKPLHNAMKRTLKKAKEKFPNMKTNEHELKA